MTIEIQYLEIFNNEKHHFSLISINKNPIFLYRVIYGF